MEDMESKLNSILGNPQMMQQIMSLAQNLNPSDPPPAQEAPVQEASSFPDIDLSMLQKLSGFAGSSSIDKDQQHLLKALGPYLSQARIQKLEKAMRSAKMARLAISLLGSGSLFPKGR